MNIIEIQDIKSKIDTLPALRTVRMRLERSIITIFKLTDGYFSINSNKIDIEHNYTYAEMISFLELELVDNKCIYISVDLNKSL